jgi:hypothetical protein
MRFIIGLDRRDKQGIDEVVRQGGHPGNGKPFTHNLLFWAGGAMNAYVPV